MNYLISFTLCSGLLLLVYHALLSSERLFRFNRFYLLGSLLFSLMVPFITIETAWKTPEKEMLVTIQPASPIIEEHSNLTVATYSGQVDETTAAQPVNWKIMAATGYALITFVLLGRFIGNLYSIWRKTKGPASLLTPSGKLILAQHPIAPHSFFNYIFLNRDEYENGAINHEVICHEQAHARQLHSIDVMLIELIQVLAWFNPFILFYRKAIQLNHEYLADAEVVERNQDTISYQYIILAMSGGQQQPALMLSSAFNYKTIKNRLLMLSKTTSRRAAFCRQLAVLPAITLAVLLFSEKIAAQAPATKKHAKPTTNPATNNTQPHKVAVQFSPQSSGVISWAIPDAMRPKHAAKDAPENIIDEYAGILKTYNLSDTSGKISDISATDKERMHQLFMQMSARQQDAQWIRFTKTYLPSRIKTNNEDLKTWAANKDYGVWVDNKRVKNETLANYTADDFYHVSLSHLTPRAVKNDGFKTQIDLTTKTYYKELSAKAQANKDDHLIHIHRQNPNRIAKPGSNIAID